MKKIDRYIISKFLGTFVYAVILFSIVAIVIDLVEKIDNFIENDASVYQVVFDYYVNFLPYIDALLSPLFIFIAVIFFTSRMAANTEIVAILSGGVSFYRMLWPYLFTATILAGALLYANHNLVPNANKERLLFEERFVSSKGKFSSRNLHLQINPDEYIYIETYSIRDSTGYKFSYEVIQDGRLLYKIRADRIQWNGMDKEWRLRGYTKRVFGRQSEVVSRGESLDTTFNFVPADLGKRVSRKQEMRTKELKAHIGMLKERGAENVEEFEVEYHKRTADAFAAFILTLIGVSIASRKVRGGIGLHIAFGFALSALYIVSMQFSTTFSIKGNLPVIIGVWLPNFVFGLLAVFLVWRAPK